MNQISYFWKINATKILGNAYAVTRMRMHA